MTEDNTLQADAAACSDNVLAATIVSAYVSNNPLPADNLPGLVSSVRSALKGDAVVADPEPSERKPTATEIKKSVTNDAITSFIDGKPYKTLKRHLTKYGETPESYRARFGLDPNYPMVAPGYAEARSKIAKQTQLGVVRRPAAA